jgi:uncharacterized membrane protein YccF (DUF307 family)
MTKSPSMTLTTALDVLMPTLAGVVFFFLIIGVFGFWVAIGGLVFAVVLALTVFVRRPDAEVGER